MKLEEEFEIAKTRHKFRVLTKKMVDYFQAIEVLEQPTGYYKSPKRRAREAIMTLVMKDINLFNSLYERAYEELIESEV